MSKISYPKRVNNSLTIEQFLILSHLKNYDLHEDTLCELVYGRRFFAHIGMSKDFKSLNKLGFLVCKESSGVCKWSNKEKPI